MGQRRPKEWDEERLCADCRRPVEPTRRCYAIPTCYDCLPPPPLLTIAEFIANGKKSGADRLLVSN